MRADVPSVVHAGFTMNTVPARQSSQDDSGVPTDAWAGLLDGRLTIVDRAADNGLPDTPRLPHCRKADCEPVLSQPSRRRKV
jgi:hypothetical protein